MDMSFEHLRITRQRYQDIIEAYSFEKLIEIPEGFNNNLLWNYGHTIVTQHLLCIGLSNEELTIPMDIVNKYRKGSSPKENPCTQIELDYFKANEENLIKLTENLLRKKDVESFKEYETSFGVTLKTLDDAIAFNNIHEGLHLGYCMALRKHL